MTLKEAIKLAQEKAADDSTTPIVAEVLAVLLEALKRRGHVSSRTDAETVTGVGE